MKRLLLYPSLLASFLMSEPIHAQDPGSLDTDFGELGRVFTEFASWSDAEAMHILPDDRILIAGHTTDGAASYGGLIARYLPDGELDESFGFQGSVQVALGGLFTTFRDITVLDDGKILVAGHTNVNERNHMLVARFHDDGQLDGSFGTNGVSLLSVSPTSGQDGYAIAVDAEGRILLVGSCHIDGIPFGVVARLDADGALDMSFGDAGYAVPDITAEGLIPTVRFRSVLVQPDGKIVAAGYFGTPLNFSGWVARFLDDGSPDTAFGDGGNSIIFEPGFSHMFFDAKVTTDGEIVIGGNYVGMDGTVYLLMRLQPDGNVDQNFGINGYSAVAPFLGSSQGRTIMLSGGGDPSILIGGSSGDNFSIMMATSSGFIDTDFGTDGLSVDYSASHQRDQIMCIARQSNGKLVAAGYRFDQNLQQRSVALLRYNFESTLDTRSIAADDIGMQVYPNPGTGHYSIILPDGFTAKDLQLFAANGQMAGSYTPASAIETRLDLSHLPKGLYHLVASDATGKVLRCKVVKM